MSDDFFADLNLQLTDEQKSKILENVFDALEERMGDKIEPLVSDEKFEQFQDILTSDDQAKVDSWLEQNVPVSDRLFEETLEELKQEFATNPQAFL